MALQLWLTGQALSNQGILDEQMEISSNIKHKDNCFQFDGDCSQILSYKNVPKKTNNFSWCCWLKQTATESFSTDAMKPYQYILSQGRDCGCIGFNLKTYQNNLQIFMGNGTNSGTGYTSKKEVTICQLKLNTWYHIALIVDDTKVSVYVNGEFRIVSDLVDIGYTEDSNTYFTIGKMSYGHGDTKSYFPFVGQVSDVRVYDHCISAKEVKLLSQRLLLHYPMNQIGRQNNLIKHSYIANRGCTTFNYDSKTNIYNCVSSIGSSTWGNGFQIKSNKSILIKRGQTIRFSMEVNPERDCTWNFDVNNGNTDGSHTGNDNDLVSARKTSNKHITGNVWTQVWITYTAKPDVPYDIYDATSYFGIVTTSETEPLKFQIRNIIASIDTSSFDVWTPNWEDSNSWFDSTEFDTSGNGNNGIAEKSYSPIYTTGLYPPPRNLGCYRFDGGQYIKSDANFRTDAAQQMTVSIWAYMDDWSQFKSMRLFSCMEDGGFNIENNNDNMLFFQCCHYTNADLSAYSYISTRPSIPLNKITSGWHMFTVVYSTSYAAIYLDGSLYDKQDIISYGIHYNLNNALIIGAEPLNDKINIGGGYFKGQFSDFRVYGTALSDQDIKDLYEISASVTNTGALLVSGEIKET